MINIIKRIKSKTKLGHATQYTISDRDPMYKVKYLGNVQTAIMRGEGCVDRPTSILWNNFLKNNQQGIEMELTVCSAGLRAQTAEQGLTEYRAHRISYCIAHPHYPRLFVWVYRHEAKKMKIELRCHAVMCKSIAKAKAMALVLAEKLEFSLREFKREKTRKQNKRLTLQRTNSLPTDTTSEIPARKKFLSTAQNYKPALETSTSAPKLMAISEGLEELEEEEEELPEVDDEAEEDFHVTPRTEDEQVVAQVVSEEMIDEVSRSPRGAAGGDTWSDVDTAGDLDPSVTDPDDELLGMIIGNDLDELRHDVAVQKQLNKPQDSDEESSESGFSEQDNQLTAVAVATPGDALDTGVAGAPVRHEESQRL